MRRSVEGERLQRPPGGNTVHLAAEKDAEEEQKCREPPELPECPCPAEAQQNHGGV